MVLNTITVGAAVTPIVVKTYASHYLSRKPRAQKPTAHISYDEGLNLIRQFLHYASFHTVEEIQAFTSQWVPNPRWVRCEDVTISEVEITRAADALIAQLGPKGINMVGGKTWWQWRRDGSFLKSEWIEMRAHFNQLKKRGEQSKRIMLYVHGGAYFFGSVDEHRYQLQRHARKLKARVFARYRLAPQFPFPCGLQDCLAAYLYLLKTHDPSTIILAGDSAGGGMVVSILVTLRDQGIPMPAGAILISPWVDLTHSFPSVAGDNKFDYIPAHGFIHRPSAAWPPPNSDDMREMATHAVEKLVEAEMPRKSTQQERQEAHDTAIQGFSVEKNPKNLNPKENDNNPAGTKGAGVRPGNTIPGPGHDISIMIDEKLVNIKDQIQIYTTNQLISHPLVSTVLQPSLGGLPPLLILTGGGEMLRDEQIYLAHKAANPAKYGPGEAYLKEYPNAQDLVKKHKPTDVQLQVWDDLCHVAPTLSFTRPAKFMYRSIAQFGAWVLARAQKTEIEIMDDDDVSVISSGSDTDAESDETDLRKTRVQNGTQEGAHSNGAATDKVGKAGDALPPFRGHMIRQRVNRHGLISPLDHPSDLPALQVPANEIGVVKPGPVRKWMAAKAEWDSKFAKEKRRVQKRRINDMVKGYEGFGNDEVPPPSALAGRRGANMPKQMKVKRSWGMSLWSLWGSSHDEKTLEREEKVDKEPETSPATAEHGTQALGAGANTAHSRSRSRRRTVVDQGQVTEDGGINEDSTVHDVLRHRAEAAAADSTDPNLLSPTFVPLPHDPGQTSPGSSEPPTLVLPGSNITLDSPAATRPKADGIAFPFKLGRSLLAEANASTITLKSAIIPAESVGIEKEDHDQRNSVGAGSSEVLDEAKSNGLEKDGSGDLQSAKRPNIERFETAQEQL